MSETVSLRLFDPDSLLTELESLVKSSTEIASMQHGVEEFWMAHGERIRNYVKSGDSNQTRVIKALERYADSAPAKEFYALTIAKADQLLLHRMHSVYDIWSLLVDLGRRPLIRGKERDWEAHEKPLVESYRWEVEARRTRILVEKVKFFDIAALAASAGKTIADQNRTRHLKAHAFRVSGDCAVRSNRWLEAANNYEQGREYARGTHLEYQLGFREKSCTLRQAEIDLQWDEALAAHQDAMNFVKKLPEPERLFLRPNPWISLKDFENESKLIVLMRSLHTAKLDALNQAILEFIQIIDECIEGWRHTLLTERLIALKTLKAMVNKQPGVVDSYIDELSKLLHRPIGGNSKDLFDLLSEQRLSAELEDLVGRIVPLLPLDAVSATLPPIRPLMHGAPKWLNALANSIEENAPRILLLWYSRLVLDWLWSVYEKDCQETKKEPRERPFIRRASIGEVAEYASAIMTFIPWMGLPGIALRDFVSDLRLLAECANDVVTDEVKSFLRATDFLLPLVCGVAERAADRVVLKRMDNLGPEYSYLKAEINRSALGIFGSRAYVKPRYRDSVQQPRDREGRPLYLYPAPSCPEFLCACMIVEGKSDMVFFETILDRIEPGWKALRSESEPERPAIIILPAGGADGVPGRYKRAREKGSFCRADPLLDAGSERIVVIVDAEKALILKDKRSGLDRCNHTIVLDPDLERIAPSAFHNALARSLGRALTFEEKQDIKRWFALSAREFEEAIATRFDVHLKRQPNPKQAITFARYLGETFPPHRTGGNAPWNRVWEACNRLLLLASGPMKMRPLKIH
jgi:hypothetical protein